MSEGGLDPMELNRRMIAELRRRGSATSERVISAFGAVPRHAFLPEASLTEAYSEAEAVPIRRDVHALSTSSSSAPSIVGSMLEQLEVSAGAEVLEVGTGSGYNAALLDVLVGPEGSVTTIDLQSDVADDARAALARTDHVRVEVRSGDGWDGVRDRAPFDAIEVTAGTDDISPNWAKQLRDEGRIVLPLWLRAGIQISVAFRKEGRAFRSLRSIPCGFMRLQGGNEPVSATVKVGTTVALFDAPELSASVESLLRLRPTMETAMEPPPGWFERAALDESELLPISMFEEGSWTDRRGFFDPRGGSIAVVSGTEISVYGSSLAAATLRERMKRAKPLDLSTFEIVAVPTPEGPQPQASWTIVRPCFTFLLQER